MRNKNIKIIEGNGSVLISAPHAVSIEKTAGERTYTRMAEEHADKIVKNICQKNSAWGILTTSENGPLKNWQEGVYGEYKKTVKHIIKNENIELVIDIHGAKKSRPFYIDYDFMIPNKHPHDKSIEDLFCKVFTSYFPSEKLSSGFYRKIKGPGKKTLTYYIRKHFSIPAIQLEINKSLKENEQKLEQVIEMLYSFIATYEDTFTGIQQKKEIIHG